LQAFRRDHVSSFTRMVREFSWAIALVNTLRTRIVMRWIRTPARFNRGFIDCYTPVTVDYYTSVTTVVLSRRLH
jgi:hypothetical protein